MLKIKSALKSVYSNPPRFVAAGVIILTSAIVAEVYFIFKSISHLPPQIPLWYTNPWGTSQLASPRWLWAIPVLALIVLAVNVAITQILLKAREALLAKGFFAITGIVISLLLVALHRIILISTPETLPPLFLQTKVLVPFVTSFAAAVALSFPTLKLAKRWGLVDDPRTHKHPGMLLTTAIPRAGALPLIAAIVGVGLLFLPVTKHFIGIYLGMLIMTVMGLLDDKRDLHPYWRLGGQLLAIAAVVGSGIGISHINDPFNGVIQLDTIIIPINIFGEHSIFLLADLLAVAWILWTMNMLSWSNGVDGQFPGIAAISFIVIGGISLRVANQQPDQWPVAMAAFVAAGACLGTLPFTWHPSKYLYGFGATAVGLLVASLSILSGAKVATAIVVLLVPTMDAGVTIIRRLRRGQNPIWGDREHLHHLLLALGLNQKKVAVFYWLTCALFGTIALYSSGREKVLLALTAAGLVGFGLIAITRETRKQGNST